MYAGSRGPSDEELARYGLTRDDVEDAEEIIDLWPENMQAFGLFDRLGTQWRVGMSGATGLDYTAVQAVMVLTGVKRSDQPALFDDIRVLERAALDVMAEGRE
jgi:hypothetical protein